MPNEKNCAISAICAATSAARGSSIIVPIWCATGAPSTCDSGSATTSAISAATACSSCTVPTSGTMISGSTAMPSAASAAAARVIARTCIANSPGTAIPRRTPRSPSIGFCSCSRRTEVSSSSFSVVTSPRSRATATSTESSVRSGRNSCSGGSSSRIVTGRPSIAR